MSNVQSVHQTGQQFDARHKHSSAIFCRSDDSSIFSSGLCLSDRFDEHGTDAHVQRHEFVSIVGTSSGHFIRKQLENKLRHRPLFPREVDTHWLTFFLASQARVFCRRAKLFDPNRYPSLEQWILVIHCHCSSSIDFYFDEPQANQFMCDYLDTLSLKGRPMNARTSAGIASRLLHSHVIRRNISVDVGTISVGSRTRSSCRSSTTCDRTGH